MRIGDSLKGKRVLITQCEEFMGPVLTTAFEEHGAVVIGAHGPMGDPASAEAAVRAAGGQRHPLPAARLCLPCRPPQGLLPAPPAR